MNWQKLDRETTAKIVNSVKSSVDAGLFSAATSEVERAGLHFYQNYDLYRLTNYASLPSFSFQYIGNGTFFHYLDGTEKPIYDVNDKGVLQLGEYNILEYLDFFFSHVADEDGESTLIKGPSDMPFLDSLDTDSYDAVMRNHRPPRVDYDAGYDIYEVEAELYNQGQLIRAQIVVNEKGRVEVKNHKMIMNQVSDFGPPEAVM